MFSTWGAGSEDLRETLDADGFGLLKNLAKGTYLAILHPTAEIMTKRTKKKTKRAPPKDRNVYVIYVIELDSKILKKKDFLKENPNRDPSKPCVYVGMTSKTPEERFAIHQSEHLHSSPKVREFGIALMRELYEHLNPLTREEVEDMEQKLAEDLRSQGYAVWQR